MAGQLEVAAVEYGTETETKRRTALVTFRYAAGRDGMPNPQDFQIEVIGWDGGDPTATVNDAKRAVHQLMLQLAEQTADWA